MDIDPRAPAYIATQAPLANTLADFWQMVWEQGSVVIVNLTHMSETDINRCRYWPDEGSALYHFYEVHLVSEHVWCEDYLVRSFYLKNLETQETRTVTQFHFLTWPETGVPPSPKSLLEFRRSVYNHHHQIIISTSFHTSLRSPISKILTIILTLPSWSLGVPVHKY
nr:receptor-type tyrosine-protein phosphatase-like N [Lytechinus pictus]